MANGPFPEAKDKTVRLWDCKTSKQLYCLPLGYEIGKVQLLPDGKSILISTDQPAMQLWELFDEEGRFQPALKWTTGSATLSAQQLNMEGIKGLSDQNQRLLLQHGGAEDKS